MQFSSGHGVAVILGLRHVVDDVDVQRVAGSGAIAVGDRDGERLAEAVGAVGGGVSFVVVEGVAVAHHPARRVIAGDGQGVAQRSGEGLREAGGDARGHHVDPAHAQALHAIQCGNSEGTALGQCRGARRRAIAEGFFIDRQFPAQDLEAVDQYRIVVVVHGQGQGRSASVAIGVGQGVGEGFVGIGLERQECRDGRVDGVGIGTIRCQHQLAIGACQRAGRHRTSDHSVGALHIVVQHIAGKDRVQFSSGHGVAVILGLRHVVDDVDVQRVAGSGAIAVGDRDGERLAEAVGAVGGGVSFVVVEGVAVAHHPARRVIAGDGQGVAQRSGESLREAGGDARGHHVDPAHAQALHAIQCGNSEGTALGQCRGARRRAIAEGFFIDRQFPAQDLEAIDQYRIVVVVNVEHQVGAAAVAISVGQGVVEGLGDVALEREKSRIAAVQGVAVAAVGGQHQGAVSAGEGPGGDRPSHDPVGPLHIVVEYVAGQDQMRFGRGNAIAVVKRVGHIVGDVDVQGVAGRIAIDVAGDHGEMLTEVVAAIPGRVGFIPHQGVAVTDHAGGRVITDDRQGVAQGRGDRLWETHRHAATDDADSTDAQALQAIRRGNAEGPVLSQGPRVAGRALGQVGFKQGQLTACHRQAGQGHRLVLRQLRGHR